MTDNPICSQVSWLDLFLEQRLYLSMQSVSEQVKLWSGDGFSVSLPSHLLLASSKLARRTFIPGENGQNILLPSVRGSTLLLLVEILRSGVTSNQGKEEIMGDRLTDIRELMWLLDIPGHIGMMKIVNKSFELRSNGNEVEHLVCADVMHNEGGHLPQSYTPVVEITRMNLDVKMLLQDYVEVDSTEMFGKSMETGQPRMCQVCKKINPNWKALKDHIRSAHGEALFPCGHCSKKFVLEKILKEHIYRAHAGVRIGCGYCPSTYRSKESLNNHMRKRHRCEMVSCRFCSMRFLHKDTLKIHMNNNHKEEQFQCSECPATFIDEPKVRLHARRVHSGIRMICSECNLTFSSDHCLRRHARSQHENSLSKTM